MLKRFKKILLLDECDVANLERAAKLTKHTRTGPTVAHVIKELLEHLRRMSLGSEPVNLQGSSVETPRKRH